MSTWLEKAEAQLTQHALALKIIEGVAHLVADALVKPDSDAHAVLQAVERGLQTIIDGFDGKISHEEADKVIKSLLDRRAMMHAAIDRRIDDKFEDGGSDP